MVELNDIAKKIEDILNTNSLGKTFRIFSDSGELAKRNGRKNEYRNGLLEVVSSTTSNLSGLEFISSSVNLTLYANEEVRGKNSDGNSIEIIELRQILGDFLENYNFKTFAEEFGLKTYSTTYVIGATTTLPKGSLGYINDCVPLITNIGLTFFENGVNSNEWIIEIDGEEVGYTNAVISRTKTAENMPLAESKSTKSVMQTNGFGLDLVVPQISSNLGNAIEEEILTGKEYAHMVYVKGKNNEQAYICVFGNLQASLIKNANVGFNVPLVEGVPELLDYKGEGWLELEVEVTDLSYNTVTILNNDNEILFILWGDGNVTKSNFEEIQHTYSNLGTYNIVAFNSKATDKDWADAVIRDYLELDKFTYSVAEKNITISKVNAPVTNYEINETYYIDNEINTVTEIGGGSTSIDSNVVSITLPNTIKNINEYAFDGTSLTTINIPNALEVVDDYAFRNTDITSITLPSTLTAIGYSVFQGCSLLQTADLSDTAIEAIGGSAFRGCSNLTSITIPNSVTIIGNQAFQNCSNLTSITLPVGLKSIQQYAFENAGITSIYIPKNVETIISGAFRRCEDLATIKVHADNLYWKNDNGYILMSKTGTLLKQYAIGSVRTSVTIPNTVVTIDFYAFYKAVNLTSVTIPNNGFTSITIATGAFSDCTSLATLNIQHPNPPNLIGSVFANCPLTKINVPSASLTAYQNASGWSDYASIMVGV